jgi:hypothetical protein
MSSLGHNAAATQHLANVCPLADFVGTGYRHIMFELRGIQG